MPGESLCSLHIYPDLVFGLLFEERRMCSYGQLTENGATDGDILIVPPWDAYWFYDRLGS